MGSMQSWRGMFRLEKRACSRLDAKKRDSPCLGSRRASLCLALPLLSRGWQELIRVELCIIQRRHRLIGSVFHDLRVQHKLDKRSPGNGLLQARPRAPHIGELPAEILHARSLIAALYDRSQSLGAVYDILFRLRRILARVFVAARRRGHETLKQVRLATYDRWAGDELGRVVIRDAELGDRESRQRDALLFCLHHVKAKDPGEVHAFAHHISHSVRLHGHGFEYALAARALNRLRDDGNLVGRAVAAVQFAIKLAEMRYVLVRSYRNDAGIVWRDR